MQQIPIDEKWSKIANKIVSHGGRMYVVGGAVRDAQLGKKAHDMDFCVTGLSVEEFNQILHVPKVQGKSFPVFILHGCEIALARKERKIGEKHTDFEALTDKVITIEEDLARRDLTINSMAVDVLTGELVDPFHGEEDLKNKVIRMTTEAYREDPLRVYRTARFAAKLGFTVEEKTLQTMESMKVELKNLSAERVLAEFRKALLTNHPSQFFDTLKKANVLDVHFPELANLIGVEQPVQYHPEGDAYTHTMEVLERAVQKTPDGIRWTHRKTESSQLISLRKVTRTHTGKKYHLKEASEFIDCHDPRVQQKELIRFCALVHDFGKAVTPREEWPHHYRHEENGVPVIHAFCQRLKVPKTFEKAGILTSRLHMKAGKFDALKPATQIKLLTDIEASRSLSFEGMEIVASCDAKKSIHFAKEARKIMQIKVTPEIKEKCTVEGVFDYEKAKQLVLQKRVEVLKAMRGRDTSFCTNE